MLDRGCSPCSARPARIPSSLMDVRKTNPRNSYSSRGIFPLVRQTTPWLKHHIRQVEEISDWALQSKPIRPKCWTVITAADSSLHPFSQTDAVWTTAVGLFLSQVRVDIGVKSDRPVVRWTSRSDLAISSTAQLLRTRPHRSERVLKQPLPSFFLKLSRMFQRPIDDSYTRCLSCFHRH